MGIKDYFKTKKQKQYDDTLAVVMEEMKRSALTAGRNASHDSATPWFGTNETVVKRDDLFSKDNLAIIKAIRDINPDASLAVWNFLRLSNQGHEVKAILPSGEVDERATRYINDELAPHVGRKYRGGMDQLINVLNLSTYTYGANALEVELSEGLKDVVDFHAVNPTILDFKINEETREQELGIYKNGEFVVLNPLQVFYSPIDPDVDEPYGRSPLMPTLNSVFFQVEVLRDLQKVMHNQGHARFDIQVVASAIAQNVPFEIQAQGGEAVARFVTTYIDSIHAQFAKLKPDDNLIHDDSVNIEMVGGTAGKSMDATAIIQIINQQVVSSLKHLPILLGRSDATSETHANVQWKIFNAGILSMQNATKRTIENAYNISLRVKGFQSRARVEFDELNVTDRLKEAQAEQMEIQNEIAKVTQGWIDNDEASRNMTGSDAVAEPAPQAPAANFPKQSPTNRATTRRLINKAEKPDPFVAEMGTEYAEELAVYTTKRKPDFEKRIADELAKIINKIEVAGAPPTDLQVKAQSIRAGWDIRDGTPPPPDLFQFWVESKILTADFKQSQLSFWSNLLNDVVLGGADIAGTKNLLSLSLDVSFDSTDKQLLEYIFNESKRTASLIRGVNDKVVLNTLWEQVYNGKYSVPKASEALSQAHGFSPERAEVIARTEIIGAGHTGQFQSDLQSGIVIAKIWRQALDSRTRDSHKEAGGQTVAFDKPFKIGKSKLLYPSDRSLGAEAKEIIQCRCYYERVLEGEKWEATP